MAEATTTAGKGRRWYFRLMRRLWHVAVLLLVMLAVYQTGGRLLMPRLGGQKDAIEDRLSQLLGANVTIGALQGSWFRFSPALELEDMVIAAGAGQRHSVERVTVQLDAVASLLKARAAITRVHADGLNVTLASDAAGRWSLAGLPRGTGPDYSQQIIDFLLLTQGIDLVESELRLQPFGGAEVLVSSFYLDLRNRGENHELASQFRINGQQSPSQLHVTLEGDPRSEFGASIYAGTSELDVGSLVATREAGGWRADELSISAGAWLEASHNGLLMLHTVVSDVTAGATHPGTQRSVRFENASFKASLQPAGENSWAANIAELAFDLQQTPWHIPALQLEGPNPGAAHSLLSLRAQELDIGLLNQLALLLPQLPEQAPPILTTLNPRGMLRNVKLQTALDGSMPGGFLLEANLADVAVDAWGAAPAGSGLQGYVQAGARVGFAEIDSDAATLYLPRLFRETWQYDHLNARVFWGVTEDGFHVGSKAIQVRSDAPGRGLDGTVSFDLYNSRDSTGARVSDFSLLVGMRSMDVALGDAYLPTLPRLKPTMDWLQGALQGGRIRDSGFMLRTSTMAGVPSSANTFSTWYHVEDGKLQFLPDWPALDGISADVVVRDGRVSVQADAARIAGMALNPTVANVVPVTAGGSLLTVRGTASTDTASGLAFLRESPVRNAIGPVIDNWDASGAIDVDIALDIPLGANSAQRQDERIIAVEVQSNGSELTLNDYALTISDIDGLVRYHSASGLAAEGLDARMFDFPIVAGIETFNDSITGRRTRVTSTGRASAAALRDWPRQPPVVRNLLGYTRGEIEYTGTLDILHSPGADGVRTRLQLASDLRGLQSGLPAPFDKAAEDSDPFEMELAFMEDGEELAARYDDFLSGRIVLDAAGVNRGQLFFGDRNRDFTIRQSDENTPGLLLSGELPYFNFEEWMDVVDAMAGQATSPQRPLAEYLRLLDMRFDQLDIYGQQLDDIAVQVVVDEAGWQIDGSNTLVGGHFTIPLGTAPWTVSLDYLRFPPRPEPELDADGEPVEVEKIDLLEAVDPSTLPPFDFATAKLSIGDQNLGAFDFRFRPDRNGAAISGFRMRAEDSGISDASRTGGADIDWRYRNGVHTSSFNGAFTATDLAQVLPRWGHGANVESEEASFSGRLTWDGSPLAFALRDTSGQLQLDIRDGRFVEIQAGTARVLGALNFDALVRRLQLDFSDIFQSGYNFDSITANLALERGVVTTTDPAVIDGPSSKISINGEIDLARETIAADMEVQIPLGQNVSMLAGLLGAWPIAVSTYLASIIFADTVADFATVIYRLDGPWENPAAGFEAPASNTAAQEP